VKFRFEVLGAGPDEPELRRQLAGQPEVSFPGWLRGADYWQRIASWDAAIWFSDWEGVPVALMDALSVGTVVFYPQLHRSLGDIYAPRLDPRCHYPAGDMAAAARAVAAVCGPGGSGLGPLREPARQLVAAHTPARYLGDFADFLGEVSRRERVSRHWTQPVDRAAHHLPLGLVTRLCPGLLRRT
jgi:glycosyltransferase involved in cell wall biosynthesis